MIDTAKREGEQCSLCGGVERCKECTEVNDVGAKIEGALAVQSHVGHSLENNTWFARFYPFTSEAAAKAFEARIKPATADAPMAACAHCNGTGKWAMPADREHLATEMPCNHCDETGAVSAHEDLKEVLRDIINAFDERFPPVARTTLLDIEDVRLHRAIARGRNLLGGRSV